MDDWNLEITDGTGGSGLGGDAKNLKSEMTDETEVESQNEGAKMTNNPLLSRMMNGEKQDFLHSSAYGKVQNADKMGTASAESFATRQAMEASRQAIQKYKNSQGVSEAYDNSVVKAWGYDVKKRTQNRGQRFGKNMGDSGMRLVALVVRGEKMG